MSINNPHFGDRIRQLRRQKELTQDELLQVVKTLYNGVPTRTALSQWENGTNNINAFNLLKIAKALGVDPYYIMFGEQTNDSLRRIKGNNDK